MKTQHKTIFLLVALPIFLPIISYADQFKVIRVYDGDTVRANGKDIEVNIRLVGIDAPRNNGVRP